MASLLFVGPSGVGKTETAKAAANVLFGGENALIRLDMSEYMEKHSVSKLIGSPPGYVGYDDGGQLTERIRRRGYCVVLFDEIEKAHPDVFGLLLQILEDGTLTDSRGRRASFKNAIVIMTSNVGSDGAKVTGFASEKKESAGVSDVKAFFRPELINRIDKVIPFSYLKKEDLLRICDKDAFRPCETYRKAGRENRVRHRCAGAYLPRSAGKSGSAPAQIKNNLAH